MFQQMRGNKLSPLTPVTQGAAHRDFRAERVDRFKRFERLTHFLDDSLRVPGTNMKIGWDTLIGIVPGLGDMITTALSGYLIYEARQLGASRWVLTRMVGNVIVDFLIGAIPVAGDVFDAFFKSNRRNSRLLKKHLDRRNGD